MRKLIILIALLLPIVAGAQLSSSIGLYATKGEVKIVTESVAVAENHTAYAYTETSSAKSWYGQFFWEQKFWNAPIYLHAEYRGTMAGDWYENTAYFGAAWCYYNNIGYLALEPLFMWKEGLGVGAQASIVGEWNWKHFEIEHYTDIWRTHKMQSAVDFYIEARGYYKVVRWLSLGVIGNTYYTQGIKPNLGVYLAVKVNL